jgi:FSR family fosmidomycin resistance protein-like MFS transporter
VYGTLGAGWPLIRHDLSLGYAQIGVLLAVPALLGSVLDPLIGAAGDTRRRRGVLVLGGVAFAAAALLVAAAQSFGLLFAALLVANPASGAFVSLAQATLMDIEPNRRERNMARWTLAGSFGYVGGPLLLAGALWAGLGWRAAMAGPAVVTLPLAAAARRTPRIDSGSPQSSFSESLRAAVAALRRRDVLRWLATLEAADLLLDVFHGFLALYLVDVARLDPRAAAIGVAVWTGSGLVGDWLLLAVLRRLDGLRYLRLSALASLAVYPAFLVAPSPGAKLVLVAVLGLLNSGWYAIPKARLYEALPGQSGAAVAVGGIGGLVGAAVPLVLGMSAASFGLGSTMWLLVLGPLALLAASLSAAPKYPGQP